MANGQVKEMLSQVHPRIRQRSRRSSRIAPKNATSYTKANLLAYCLSSILNMIPHTILKICPKWILSWIKWCPTSPQALEIAENQVLSNLSRPYAVKYVNIGPCWSKEDNFIWTLSMKPHGNSEKTPLVLLHGFASGIGLWVMNLDSISSSRPVYALDVLGFGRSSRPDFSSDASDVEQQFVTCIEMWRKAVGLEKFILLGHSMGGYLASAYALQHSERIALLILVDPWGFPERPLSLSHQYEMPSWVKFVNTFLQGFNLLAAVRAVGPVGPMLVDRFRRDLHKKYKRLIENEKSITQYIYHCNAQSPSGEAAFKSMADEAGWAKYPMISRISDLHWKVPITFVYGTRSWGNRQPGLQIKYSRLNSFVGIQVVESAGHHVYADRPEQFNALINRVCDRMEDSEISSN